MVVKGTVYGKDLGLQGHRSRGEICFFSLLPLVLNALPMPLSSF